MEFLTMEQKFEAYYLHTSEDLDRIPITEIALMLNTSPLSIESAINEVQEDFIKKGYLKLLKAVKNIC